MEKIDIKKELYSERNEESRSSDEVRDAQKGHAGMNWAPGNAKPSCAIWESLTLILTSYQSISSSQGCYYVTVL